MKFENIAKAVTICTGVCMTIAGIFDVISGNRMEKSCSCEGEGPEGECECEGACECGRKTVRGGMCKIFFGGILSGLGVASLFVDFEEKLREYNPELADKLNAYEELAPSEERNSSKEKISLSPMPRRSSIRAGRRSFPLQRSSGPEAMRSSASSGTQPMTGGQATAQEKTSWQIKRQPERAEEVNSV